MQEVLYRLLEQIIEAGRKQGMDQKTLVAKAGLGASTLSKLKQADDVRGGRDLVAGPKLFGRRTAAQHVPPFEHAHFASRLGQIGGTYQAVVPSADDQTVKLAMLGHSCSLPCDERVHLMKGHETSGLHPCGYETRIVIALRRIATEAQASGKTTAKSCHFEVPREI